MNTPQQHTSSRQEQPFQSLPRRMPDSGSGQHQLFSNGEQRQKLIEEELSTVRKECDHYKRLYQDLELRISQSLEGQQYNGATNPFRKISFGQESLHLSNHRRPVEDIQIDRKLKELALEKESLLNSYSILEQKYESLINQQQKMPKIRSTSIERSEVIINNLRGQNIELEKENHFLRERVEHIQFDLQENQEILRQNQLLSEQLNQLMRENQILVQDHQRLFSELQFVQHQHREEIEQGIKSEYDQKLLDLQNDYQEELTKQSMKHEFLAQQLKSSEAFDENQFEQHFQFLYEKNQQEHKEVLAKNQDLLQKLEKLFEENEELNERLSLHQNDQAIQDLGNLIQQQEVEIQNLKSGEGQPFAPPQPNVSSLQQQSFTAQSKELAAKNKEIAVLSQELTNLQQIVSNQNQEFQNLKNEFDTREQTVKQLEQMIRQQEEPKFSSEIQGYQPSRSFVFSERKQEQQQSSKKDAERFSFQNSQGSESQKRESMFENDQSQPAQIPSQLSQIQQHEPQSNFSNDQANFQQQINFQKENDGSESQNWLVQQITNENHALRQQNEFLYSQLSQFETQQSQLDHNPSIQRESIQTLEQFSQSTPTKEHRQSSGQKNPFQKDPTRNQLQYEQFGIFSQNSQQQPFNLNPNIQQRQSEDQRQFQPIEASQQSVEDRFSPPASRDFGRGIERSSVSQTETHEIINRMSQQLIQQRERLSSSKRGEISQRLSEREHERLGIINQLKIIESLEQENSELRQQLQNLEQSLKEQLTQQTNKSLLLQAELDSYSKENSSLGRDQEVLAMKRKFDDTVKEIKSSMQTLNNELKDRLISKDRAILSLKKGYEDQIDSLSFQIKELAKDPKAGTLIQENQILQTELKKKQTKLQSQDEIIERMEKAKGSRGCQECKQHIAAEQQLKEQLDHMLHENEDFHTQLMVLSDQLVFQQQQAGAFQVHELQIQNLKEQVATLSTQLEISQVCEKPEISPQKEKFSIPNRPSESLVAQQILTQIALKVNDLENAMDQALRAQNNGEISCNLDNSELSLTQKIDSLAVKQSRINANIQQTNIIIMKLNHQLTQQQESFEQANKQATYIKSRNSQESYILQKENQTQQQKIQELSQKIIELEVSHNEQTQENEKKLKKSESERLFLLGKAKLIEKTQSELEDLRIKLGQLNYENNELQQQNLKLSEIIEKKPEVLEKEQIIELKSQEIKRALQQMSLLQQNNQSLAQKKQELEEQIVIFQALTENQAQQLQDIKMETQQVQELINSKDRDSSIRQSQLLQQNDSLEKLKNQLEEQQQTTQERLNRMQQENTHLSQELHRRQNDNNIRNSQILDQLQNTVQQMEFYKTEFEKQRNLNEENKNDNQFLVKELQDFQLKNAELVHIKELKDIRIEGLNQEVLKLQQIQEKFSQEKRELREKVQNFLKLQEDFSQLQNLNETLSLKEQQLLAEKQDLKNTLQKQQNEDELLKQQNQILKQDLHENIRKSNDLQFLNNNLLKQIEEEHQEKEFQQQQIERLKKELLENNKRSQELSQQESQRLLEIQEKNQLLEQERLQNRRQAQEEEKLQKEIQMIIQKMKFLELKEQEFEKEELEKQKKLEYFAQQNQSLEQNLKDKMRESQEQILKNQQLQLEIMNMKADQEMLIKDLKQSLKKSDDFEMALTQHQLEIQNKKQEINQLKLQYENKIVECVDLEQKRKDSFEKEGLFKINIKNEFDKKETEYQSLTKDLQQRASDLLQKISSSQEEIKSLKQNLKNKDLVLNEKNRELEKQRKSTLENSEQIRTKIQEISQLEEDISHLQTENQQLQQYKAEAKDLKLNYSHLEQQLQESQKNLQILQFQQQNKENQNKSLRECIHRNQQKLMGFEEQEFNLKMELSKKDQVIDELQSDLNGARLQLQSIASINEKNQNETSGQIQKLQLDRNSLIQKNENLEMRNVEIQLDHKQILEENFEIKQQSFNQGLDRNQLEQNIQNLQQRLSQIVQEKQEFEQKSNQILKIQKENIQNNEISIQNYKQNLHKLEKILAHKEQQLQTQKQSYNQLYEEKNRIYELIAKPPNVNTTPEVNKIQQEKINYLEGTAKAKDSKIHHFEILVLELEQNVQTLQHNHQLLQNKIQNLNQEVERISKLEELNQECEKQIQNYQKETQMLEKQIKSLKNEVQLEKNLRQKMFENQRILPAQFPAMADPMDAQIKSFQEESEQMQSQIRDLVQQNRQKQQEILRLKKEISQQKNALESAHEERQQFQLKLANLSSFNETLQTQSTAAKEKLQEASKIVEFQKIEIADKDKKLTQLNESQKNFQQHLNELDNTYPNSDLESGRKAYPNIFSLDGSMNQKDIEYRSKIAELEKTLKNYEQNYLYNLKSPEKEQFAENLAREKQYFTDQLKKLEDRYQSADLRQELQKLRQQAHSQLDLEVELKHQIVALKEKLQNFENSGVEPSNSLPQRTHYEQEILNSFDPQFDNPYDLIMFLDNKIKKLDNELCEVKNTFVPPSEQEYFLRRQIEKDQDQIQNLRLKVQELQITKEQLESGDKNVHNIYSEKQSSQEKKLPGIENLKNDLRELKELYEIQIETSAQIQSQEDKEKQNLYEYCFLRLTSRVNDLTDRLRQSLEEIQFLRNERIYNNGTLSYQDITSRLQHELLNQQEELLQMNAIRQQLENRLKAYELEISQVQQEISKHKNAYEARRRENDTLANNNQILKNQLRQLNFQLLKYKNVQLPDNELTTLISEIQELTIERDQYKQQAEKVSLDYTLKNQELLQSLQDLKRFKEQYGNALQRIHQYQAQVIFLVINHKAHSKI